MAETKAVFKNRQLWMTGSYKTDDLVLKCARISEGLSRLTETTVEFLSNDKALKLSEVVGQDIRVFVTLEDTSTRSFVGTCISAEFLGIYQGYGHFTAEVRPWLWMLTRNRESRVFQNLSVPKIITQILGDYGFSTNLQDKLSDEYADREYCVQYNESDFDFICRLMEEVGIYYYFKSDGDKLQMILADSIGAHTVIPGKAELDFHFREREYRRKDDHIFEWAAKEYVTPGKVALTDYNFEKPQSPLKTLKSIPKGSHSHKSYEQYSYPGHYREANAGDHLAKVKMEAQAVSHMRWMGVGNVRTLAAGCTFRLNNHPRVRDDTEFLITDAVHHLQIETDYTEDEDGVDGKVLGKGLAFDDNPDTYRCVFGVIPKSEQFRAPQVTPWPAISGLQTALVVGPSGEEIHTDKYGRIKVQFHWDRLGKKDDKSSCWVRTVMPWSGKGWGAVAVPRIGQEVVIHFEEGDPDRPICTGMVYNAQTMPPYGLPGNMTQSGIKTNSTKGGGGFHELMFEDKKDAELVRFQSEKDYEQIIKNNAKISIGMEKKDNGDLEQTIHRHKTETLKTGDMTFTVESGSETRTISNDQTEDIGANRTQSIGSDSSVSIGSNSTLDVGSNLTETIGSNLSTDVGSSVSLKAGTKIAEEAGTSIELKASTKISLKVGGSSIEITPAGVTIKGPMVRINGSTMTEVKGGATVIVKGGVTLIN